MKGSIEERNKGTWRIVISLGKDPLTGKYKKYTETMHCKNKGPVEKRMTALIHQLNEGKNIDPSTLTFGQFLDQWMKNYVKTNLKPKTIDWYDYIIESHLKPHLGHITLEKLTALHIQQYFNAVDKLYAKGNHTGEKLSQNSLHGHYRTIHTALQHAVRWGLLNQNVSDNTVPPKKDRQQAGRSLEPGEIEKLLAEADMTRNPPIYLMAITMGLREGELLALEWTNINFDTLTVAVTKTLREGGPNYQVNSTKTHRSNRPVVMPKLVADALKTHKIKRIKEKIILGRDLSKELGKSKDELMTMAENGEFTPDTIEKIIAYKDNSFVFTSATGNPLLPRNVVKQFKRILKRAGLEDMRFHDLRHSCATLLLMQGVPVKVVSDILGHSSTTITHDIYSHVLREMQDQAADAMDNLLTG